MQILFARHGNTFAPGDRVVWVGRETDLPLVESGREQARRLGAALAEAAFRPDAILCGGLRRTRDYAAILADICGGPAPVVDRRLDEIDYGSWAGRTAEEIAATPDGGRLLAAWNEADEWPETAGWASRRDQVLAELRAFLADLLAAPARRVVVVSSNGLLRFVPRLLPRAEEGARRSYRMATGRAGLVEIGADSGARLRCWDAAPGELGLV